MPYLGVFGHTNIDCIIKVKEFPPVGTAGQAQEVHIRLGGVAANIARCAAKINVPTALVSHVGEGFPIELYSQLAEDGVEMEFFRKERGRLSPTCYVVNNENMDQYYIIDQGAMNYFDSYEPPIDLLGDVKVLHLTTGRPGYYRKLLEAADGRKLHVSFDPAQGLPYDYGKDTDDLRFILERANSYFCNEKELGITLDYLGLGDQDELLDFVDFVLVTLGAGGSRLITGDGVLDVPVVGGDAVVDPTGAGDSYRAGFYYGFQRGKSLLECARFGATVASFVVESDGPQNSLPSEEDLLGRYGAQDW